MMDISHISFSSPQRPCESKSPVTRSRRTLAAARNIRSFRRRLSEEIERPKQEERRLLVTTFKHVDPCSLTRKDMNRPFTDAGISYMRQEHEEGRESDSLGKLLDVLGISRRGINAICFPPRLNMVVRHGYLTEQGKPTDTLIQVCKKASESKTFLTTYAMEDHLAKSDTASGEGDERSESCHSRTIKDGEGPEGSVSSRPRTLKEVRKVRNARGIWSSMRETMPFDITLGPKAINFLRKKLRSVFLSRQRGDFLKKLLENDNDTAMGMAVRKQYQDYEQRQEQVFRKLIKDALYKDCNILGFPEVGIEEQAEKIASLALESGSAAGISNSQAFSDGSLSPRRIDKSTLPKPPQRVPPLQLDRIESKTTVTRSSKDYSARNVALASGIRLSPRSLDALEQQTSARSASAQFSSISSEPRVTACNFQEQVDKELDPKLAKSHEELILKAYNRYWLFRGCPSGVSDSGSATHDDEIVKPKGISQHVEYAKSNQWVQIALALRVKAYQKAEKKFSKEISQRTPANQHTAVSLSPEKKEQLRNQWLEKEKQRQQKARGRYRRNVQNSKERHEDFLMRNDWFLEKRLQRERQCVWLTLICLQKSLRTMAAPFVSRRVQWQHHAAALSVQRNWKEIKKAQLFRRKMGSLIRLSKWTGRVKHIVRVKRKNRAADMIKAFLDDFCREVNATKVRFHISRYRQHIKNIQKTWRLFHERFLVRMTFTMKVWRSTILRMEEVSEVGGSVSFGERSIAVVPMNPKEALREFRKSRRNMIEAIKQTAYKLPAKRVPTVEKYKILLNCCPRPEVTGRDLGTLAGLLRGRIPVNTSLRKAAIYLAVYGHSKEYAQGAKAKREIGETEKMFNYPFVYKITRTLYLLQWIMQAFYVATVVHKERINLN